jgi:Flp pilus assembly protein TadG
MKLRMNSIMIDIRRRVRASRGKGIFCEQGATLVEMALATTVYVALFVGTIELCLGLYTYNYISDAAREATRWVAVRGANSCTISSTFPSCNLLPTDVTSTTNPSANPVLSYVYALNYPSMNPSNLSVSVTWWVASQNGSGSTSWTTQCTGATDANGNPCNATGNQVKVVVTYSYPLSIPFSTSRNVALSSTSEMMINE